MAFSDTETSPFSAQPVELYRFTGSNKTWRLTSYPRPITVSGETFVPLEGLKRTVLRVGTQEEEKLALDVTLPYDFELVTEYAFRTAPPTLTFELLRTHRSALNEAALLWTGKVLSFSVDGRNASLRIPSLFSYLLTGVTPEPRYQGPCNHALYDARCKVNPASHSATTTITNIASNVVTVASSAFADDVCVAGDMSWNSGGESRMIISHAGTEFVLAYPFAALEVGDSVTIRKGCDHSFATCKSKFANGANFGGCPLVPDLNPFLTSL